MPNWTDLYNELSPTEKAYLGTHPHHIWIIKRATDIAYEKARLLFPGSQEDGVGDAFRHAFASAMLARDIGVENAYGYTFAHEDIPLNLIAERQMDLFINKRQMDLFNNHVGIQAFAKIKKPKPSNHELESEILRLLFDGKLKVLK